jgi:uncharacterized protein YoaH (UPF0181 family)
MGRALRFAGAQQPGVAGAAKYQTGRALQAAERYLNPLRMATSALFDTVKPRLMSSHAQQLKREFMAKGMTESEAMRWTAQRVRNVYGHQRFEFETNFLADPKVQRWGHALMFSFNWTTGTTRQAFDVIPRRGKPPEYTQASMRYAAQAGALYYAVHDLVNMYFTWKESGTPKHIWENPKGYELDAYLGKDYGYAHVGKQFREVFRMVNDFVGSAWSKASVPLRVLGEQILGGTPSLPLFKGTPRVFPVQAERTGKPWGGAPGPFFGKEQLPARLRHLGSQVVPFSVRSVLEREAHPAVAAFAATRKPIGAPQMTRFYQDSFEEWSRTGNADKFVAKELDDLALRQGVNPKVVRQRAIARVRKELRRQFDVATKEGGEPSKELIWQMVRMRMRPKGLAEIIRTTPEFKDIPERFRAQLEFQP